MPDTKISAMPSALDSNNTDAFPVVRGALNLKMNRDVFLTANAGIIDLVCLPGAKVRMKNQAGTAIIQIVNDVDISLGVTVGVIGITYKPGNPLSWNGVPPIDVWQAIDRCAALLKVLNLGVGP